MFAANAVISYPRQPDRETRGSSVEVSAEHVSLERVHEESQHGFIETRQRRQHPFYTIVARPRFDLEQGRR